MNMVNFLDGMDGLAAGVCGIAGFTFAVIALSLGKPTAASSPRSSRGVLRLPAPQLLPGADLHGRLGSAAARLRARHDRDPGAVENRVDRRVVLPARDARDPDPRHDVRALRRLKHGQKLYAADQSPALPLPAARLLAAARGADDVRLVRDMAGAAFATRFVPFREGGEWHLWPTLLALAIGLVAVAFSIYVVYVLEIVKLTNRRGRRREEAERGAEPPSETNASSSALNRSPRRGIGCPALRYAAREAFLEDVADSIEGGIVSAETTSPGTASPQALVERYRRLVRRALPQSRPLRRLDRRRRQGSMRVQRRPDRREEELEIPARILRGACLEVGEERLDRRVAAGHAEAGLDDRGDANGARAAASSETTAPYECAARWSPGSSSPASSSACTSKSIASSRVRRVARPDGDDELEAVGERLLRVPGEPSGRDRAVDEDEPGTRAETLDMHRTMMNENPACRAGFRCLSFGMLASSG